MLKTSSVQLRRLAQLAADEVIIPHIQEIMGLTGVAAAQRRMEAGRVHGKLCVRVDS